MMYCLVLAIKLINIIVLPVMDIGTEWCSKFYSTKAKIIVSLFAWRDVECVISKDGVEDEASIHLLLIHIIGMDTPLYV